MPLPDCIQCSAVWPLAHPLSLLDLSFSVNSFIHSLSHSINIY